MTAEELREWRAANGLTQEQLAHALGVSFSTVNRWESLNQETSRRIPKHLPLALKALERKPGRPAKAK